MAKSVKIPIEFGGGVRQKKSIRQALACGIQRVVLGTKLEDEDFLRSAFREFKQQIIISIDMRDNAVRISGWKRQCARLSILALIRRLENIGFKQIIYTDISRDGTLKGPNIAMIKRILKESKLSIIASGGVSNITDLLRLKALSSRGLAGVIVGKALYEGRFTLREALKKIH